MSLELLTHRVSYIPDRIESGRFAEQMKAMEPVPRQMRLQTLMLIVTLLCGAAAAAGGFLRAAQQEQAMKQSK